MKLFVILSSIAVCFGAQAGYNYQPPEDVNVLATYGPTFGVAPLGVGIGAGIGAGFAPQPEPAYVPPAGESYHKEFYTFGAPEEDFEEVRAAQQIAASMQKNLRVIFIRAPENRGLEHAALSLAKLSTDDRTAIFVLNKQHDIGDLAQRLSVVREQQQHRPEVHFVKYRTPEEAAHAQRYIQAQYDALQGTTHNADGGVAPVLNFASRPQLPSVGAAYGSGGLGYSGAAAGGVGYGGAAAGGVGYSGAAAGGVGYGGAAAGGLGYGGAAAGGVGYGGAAAGGLGYGGAAAGGLGYGGAAAGGYDAAYFGAAGALAALQRGASVGDANGIGDGAALAGSAENTVGKITSQLAASGGNFVFPTEVGLSSTYLPPLKAKH